MDRRTLAELSTLIRALQDRDKARLARVEAQISRETAESRALSRATRTEFPDPSGLPEAEQGSSAAAYGRWREVVRRRKDVHAQAVESLQEERMKARRALFTSIGRSDAISVLSRQERAERERTMMRRRLQNGQPEDG